MEKSLENHPENLEEKTVCIRWRSGSIVRKSCRSQKYCKMSLSLPKSASIQPRTEIPKFEQPTNFPEDPQGQTNIHGDVFRLLQSDPDERRGTPLRYGRILIENFTWICSKISVVPQPYSWERPCVNELFRILLCLQFSLWSSKRQKGENMPIAIKNYCFNIHLHENTA